MTPRTKPDPDSRPTPWQLQMFKKSLKKQQKVRVLLELLGPLSDKRCLLITNGDNNGALNYHFRAAGGRWTWAEMEKPSIAVLTAFLGETVHHASAEALPFADASFDSVVVVDVHEHLSDVRPFNSEIARIVAPGGLVVVSTPNGDESLPVAVLKRWVGMTPEVYGHVVQGFRMSELESMVVGMGLRPEGHGCYSRFFTELAELAINFGYVKVLSGRGRGPSVPEGTIAPNTEEQLRSVNKAYRVYSLIYPFVRAFSALDALVTGEGGYALAIAARKPV